MLVVALLMFMFGTFDGAHTTCFRPSSSVLRGHFLVAFGLRHNLDAFIYYHGTGGAAEEFQDIGYWVNIMKTVDFVAQTAIGDSILVSLSRI